MKVAVFVWCLIGWICNGIVAQNPDEAFNYYKENIEAAALKLNRELPAGAMGSLLKYPELAFEPNLDGIIVFSMSKESTYKKYTDKLTSIIERYADENVYVEGRTTMYDCRGFWTHKTPDMWDGDCSFDITENLGLECDEYNSYGYADGRPCVLLHLDRIYNWVPEPYSNDTVPDAIRSTWSPAYINVKCETTDPLSKDNLGPFTQYPKAGFHMSHFPYTGRQYYLTPLVMVQLENITPGVAVEVKCTTWAKNMDRRDLLNTGSVKFNMMVQ